MNLKKCVSMLLILCVSVMAQGTLSLVAPTPPAGGYSPGAVIPVNLVKAGNSTSAIQFSAPWATNIATVSWVLAPALAPAKALTCGGVASPTICTIVGFNQTLIPDGTIATATVTLANSIATSPVTFSVTNPIESDINGASLAVSLANPTISFSIKNPCAVTGGGSVVSADLSAVISQIIAKTTTAATDLDSSGTTNVLDAQIVATAGSTGVCNAH